MGSSNISRLFYKDYFSEIKFSYLFEEKANKEVEADKIRVKNRNITREILLFKIPKPHQVQQTINLKVAYPGLVSGVGINHEAKIEGEFKLGVHFDYTYGMPIIHGSSVKGLLRSAFPESISQKSNKSKENFDKRKKLREAKISLILSYLGRKDQSGDFVDKLREQIFEGKLNGQSQSIYKRDIFYDAVIVEANKKGFFLDSDSITPHTKGEFKNPIPITFLKIASGVSLEFRFDLKPCLIDELEITPAMKQKLFEAILRDFGIGAKTNVGYGQFVSERSQTPELSLDYIGKITTGTILNAMVLDESKKKVRIVINGDEKDCEMSMSGVYPSNETFVEVEIRDVAKDKSIKMVRFRKVLK